MSTRPADHGGAARAAPLEQLTPPVEECWRRIGVGGDRSCPELETYIHCRNCPVLAEAARTFFDRAAPEGYLESWRQILEAPEITPDSDASSVLVFRLEHEWLALPTAVVVEVTNPRPLHRIPHRAGTVLEGLVNIRGQLQLCVSLRGLLGLDASGPTPTAPEAADGTASIGGLPTTRMLVVERGGDRGTERWVFPVDEVAGVQRVARAALRTVPSTVSHAAGRSTLALFDWQGQRVGVLDDARVFDGLRERVVT
jgi:chemotaxis-related protein WspD